MSPTVQEEARKQWAIDQNSIYNLPQLISYFKSDNVLGLSEFEELDTQHQKALKALKAKTKPSYEIFSVSLISHRDPTVKRNISLRLGLHARLLYEHALETLRWRSRVYSAFGCLFVLSRVMLTDNLPARPPS